MQAFGYQPKDWVPEPWFLQPATVQQQRYLQAVKDNGNMTQRQMKDLCCAILEEFGVFPVKLNCGTVSILMDFFKYAPAKCKREAERHAWREYA